MEMEALYISELCIYVGVGEEMLRCMQVIGALCLPGSFGR